MNSENQDDHEMLTNIEASKCEARGYAKGVDESVKVVEGCNETLDGLIGKHTAVTKIRALAAPNGPKP